MKLLLEGVVMELEDGQAKSRLSDVSDVATKLDGSEIDGTRFSVSEDGNRLMITMEGDELSADIKANYPAPRNAPIMQIAFKSPEARFTANTINKLIRRANKEFNDKALLIRDITEL
ncbi:MAG: hypothetical protein DRO99_00155 [Candidatus Aenigmatarchaeota archaeon]|nr:MAG: hypothetical protein DRO99_00155 [Candidatus Aenigmarchaeota archaeon]